MKKIIQSLTEGNKLSLNNAYDIIQKIGHGEVNASQLAAFMNIYTMRAIHPDELNGFRKALLDMSIKFHAEEEVMDVCGTGGDSKNTFNISTATAIVMASCGVKIAKHGNYGVSGISGSSNVMEHFGFKFSADESVLKKQLEQNNICFLHAPLFHPALKHVGPVRKELGVRTFFNMLGPLINPSEPQFQMNGVYSKTLARTYHAILQKEEKSYFVFCTEDGYDEISLTAPVNAFSKTGEHKIVPIELGFDLIHEQDLYGGQTVESSAEIFLNVLKNEESQAKKNVVIAGSALGISLYRKISYEGAREMADHALASGKAFELFREIIKN